jgi:hypothetical protein
LLSLYSVDGRAGSHKSDTGGPAMSDYIRIVYYAGIKTEISTAMMFSYEESDYALASRRIFRLDEEEAAKAYARELAKTNGLKYIGDRSEPDLLD